MHQRSQRSPGTAQAQPVQQRRLASAQRPELLRKLETGEGDLSGPSRLTFSLANIPLFPPTPAEVSPEEGASSQTDAPPQTIHAAAAQGIRTPASSLPYADRLQRAFGQYDLSNVQTHMDSQARRSARAMQATAFTSGNHIVFASSPDLHTAAHEAAHIVQQRAGVHLSGGVGVEGDRYEQHAETVAGRVMAGQSVEELLDRFTGRSQQKDGETSPGGRPSATVLKDQGSTSIPALSQPSRPSVQRLRAGLTEETKPLSQEEEQAQKTLLTREEKATGRGKKSKKELVELDEKVDGSLLRKLSSALIKAAKTQNKKDEKARLPATSAGNDLEKTPYAGILTLAIDKVLGQYGSLLKGALAENSGKGPGPLAQVAQKPEDKSPILLKRPQQIYDDLNKQGQEAKEHEAREAIQYVIRHTSTVQTVMKDIRAHHQKGLSPDQEIDPISVQAAYVDALLEQEDRAELVEQLSRQRALHAPQTRGSTIHIAPAIKENEVTAWTHYREIVHEAIHTAAHSNFEKYLNSVPEELRDVVNEGTIDYFARKIWLQVVSDLQANKSNPEYQTVHSIIPGSTRDQITAEDVKILQEFATRYLYSQVKTIEEAVQKLGEDRLKAAFFYGDVTHFFPAFLNEIQKEVPSESMEMGKETKQEEEEGPEAMAETKTDVRKGEKQEKGGSTRTKRQRGASREEEKKKLRKSQNIV